MFKNAVALFSVMAVIFLSAPLWAINFDISVCKNGKSSGVFITENVTISDLVSCDGISVNYSVGFDYSNLINKLKAKKVHSFYDGFVQNVYFYTNKLPKKEIINGKAVNLHIAITSEKIVIGTPIIYAGY